MITAQEARNIFETSEEFMTKRLKDISEKIVEAAKLSKREIILDYVLPYDSLYKVDKLAYHPAAFTEPQILLKKELEKVGFAVRLTEQKHDGKGGLGCLDDDPQPFSTWHIKVSW